MRLFGSAGSTCTEKVLFTLAEKGQQAESVFVNLATGEHKKPEHLARHPFGVIPALEDDGFQLYEARAIIQYLDWRFPEPSLTPASLHDRARMAQWISVEQSYLGGGGIIRRNLVYGRFIGVKPDLAEVEKAKEAVGRTLDVLEKALEGREWLAGSFSLAEINLMPELESYNSLPQIADVITSRPNLERWFQRIRSRPAWQGVLEAKREVMARFAKQA